MRFFDRFGRGQFGLTRLEAFSDAVFAIVVTLLVLELKVPEIGHHDDVGALAQALSALLPKFLSWLISFIIVCKFWINHHHLIAQARHANYALLWLNSLFLMGQSFIPFPTALAGEYPDNPLAITLFGVMFAINTALFLVLQLYILRNLLKPDVAATQNPAAAWLGLIGVVSYLIGAAAAWVDLRAAFVIYALTPLLFVTPWQSRAEPSRAAAKRKR